MKIADLEKKAADMAKSMNGTEAAEPEETSQLGVVGKALDLLKSVISSPRLKKAFGPMDDGDDDEDEEKKKKMEELMGAKKSGETKQPYGDQNSLNTGDMDSPTKIKKKFNYDAKMEDDDLDLPENTKVPYYDEKRNVRKSISDISNDQDLSEDEKVFVINEQLEKGFDQIYRLSGQVEDLKKSLEIIAFSQSVLLDGLKKSMEHAANTGRGRVSMLSAVDKAPSTAKSVSGSEKQVSRTEFMTKALKAQKAGRLGPQQISEIETCFNDGYAIRPELIQAVNAE